MFKIDKNITFFYRNVLKLEHANTTEINPETIDPLIIEMPEHCTENKGGTMRLGKRTTVFTDESSIICKVIMDIMCMDIYIFDYNYR